MRKKVNGALVRGWLYRDALQPAAELDASGAVVARFVYGERVNVPEVMIKRHKQDGVADGGASTHELRRVQQP